MQRRIFFRTLTAIALIGSVALSELTAAQPLEGRLLRGGGVLLLAEQRFNPAVQRLLAERELKALPLRRGELFYLVPQGLDPRHEQAQIQYLEHLLEKRARAEAAESAAPAN